MSCQSPQASHVFLSTGIWPQKLFPPGVDPGKVAACCIEFRIAENRGSGGKSCIPQDSNRRLGLDVALSRWVALVSNECVVRIFERVFAAVSHLDDCFCQCFWKQGLNADPDDGKQMSALSYGLPASSIQVSKRTSIAAGLPKRPKGINSGVWDPEVAWLVVVTLLGLYDM
jgi:hypothetical protein